MSATGRTGRIGRTAKRVAPRWAKNWSRPVFRSIGRATWRLRPPPDFLIIGAKRGGTQTMLQYLQRHPNVLPLWPGVENAKKTRYFDQNFARGERWYRAHFPTTFQRRRRERATGGPVVSGEAAPYYMFHPLVAARVAEALPNVKLVVLLRNPVDRVWSHYHERVVNRVESLSFQEALDAEDLRLAGEVQPLVEDPRYYSSAHDNYSYLARGRYLEHLEPWYERFDAGQIHVVRSEDLYTRPTATMLEVQRFLGLPPVEPVPHWYNRVPAEAMNDRTRAWLSDYYRRHVEDLERYLDRDFRWDL